MYLYDSRPGLIGFVVKNVVLRQVFLPNISVFLPSISVFLPSISVFLPNISVFLPSISVFLPSISVFLPSITVFLPSISVFLPSISGFPLSIQPVLQDHAVLTFWRRNYFFLILAQPVYKMWIIQEPNTIELWNKLHFEEEKTEFIPCLKYSVPIFVE